MKKTYVMYLIALCCFVTGSAFAENPKDPVILFDYHGCINCHGENAKNPISKVVPKLAGKPADELFSKAKKILSGQGGSKESKLMHAAFYSPSSCDMPPSDEELKIITTWISTIPK